MSKSVELMVQEITWDLYTYAYDYDGNNNMIYRGRAAIGSSKNDPVWQIQKFIISGINITDQQWADNGSFNNVWTTRDSVPTYS
jgi:hypothetical protein